MTTDLVQNFLKRIPDTHEAATHIDANDCGVTKEHILAIEPFMKECRTFLFLRPSELDTMRLIADGTFATKSMDVHDKSSN